MLSARDLLVLARRRAGLTQAELAQRLGRPRSTIARWELGEMQPSYDAVRQAIAACDLDAMVELVMADNSYLSHIDDYLRVEPIDRLRKLYGGDRAVTIERLAAAGSAAIVIGDTAGALHGWPLLLTNGEPVELCPRDPLPGDLASAGVAVLSVPPGTRGYGDLRRDSELVNVPGGQVRVASPLDLVRIERARYHGVQAGALEAVLEYRRRWPDGPRPKREYTDEEAAAAIETWLTRH